MPRLRAVGISGIYAGEDVKIQPDQAEEAMLRNIIYDLLKDMDCHGEAECRFRCFQIQIRRLSGGRRHLSVVADQNPLIEADIDVL